MLLRLCSVLPQAHPSVSPPAGGGQQPGAGGSVQRAGQHGPGAAAGRRDAAVSTSKHPGP